MLRFANATTHLNNRLALRTFLLAALSLVTPCVAADAKIVDKLGRLAGVTSWVMPDGPHGLHPNQSWHATGSTPNGDIYVAGMDHLTNSVLYRLKAGTDDLRLVGDARSASEAARNWKPGETAQKFHTRPTWFANKVWVATMDRSELDDDYLLHRGFHWYAYDPDVGAFKDVSAASSSGVGAPHVSIVTLAPDAGSNVLYGAGVPTGHIYRLNPSSLRSDDLGRPASYKRPFLYAGRFMWVGRDGRLYFTSGNPRIGGSDPASDSNLHAYDPARGMIEMHDWRLVEPRALETGRCATDRSWCIMADDRGNLYRYEAAGPSFKYIGKVALEREDSFLWMFQVVADGTVAYATETTYVEGAGASALFEIDLRNGATRKLCRLDEIDPALIGSNVHTGYDAFDNEGRFAFASFRGDGKGKVILTRIDIAKLKVALSSATHHKSGSSSPRPQKPN